MQHTNTSFEKPDSEVRMSVRLFISLTVPSILSLSKVEGSQLNITNDKNQNSEPKELREATILGPFI